MWFHEILQASLANSFDFHFRSLQALHNQKLSNCCRHKYSQSILQIFWILFLAGFCYLTQLCSEACVISLLLPHYSQFSEAMHNGTYNNLEMISFSKFIGFLNFKVNAYTFLLISFSTDWNGKSLLRLYLLVRAENLKSKCVVTVILPKTKCLVLP